MFAESGLKSFTVPTSLKRIEGRAFAHCRNLKHADFSASTLQSGGKDDFFSESVFSDSGLESIVLPSTLKVIRED